VDSFVPSMVADAIRSLVLTLPGYAQLSAFAVIFSICAYIFVKLILYVWALIDYQFATLFRRIGTSPLFFQYPIGDVLEAVPPWIRRAGIVFSAGTIFWQFAHDVVRPPASSTLGWFVAKWHSLLIAVWR
jgi:hypothetical protein